MRPRCARLGGGLHGWSCHERKRIFAAMRSRVGAAINTQLADLIVAWARRRWPALRLVPAHWIRPAVRPAAIRMRRVLASAALILAAATALMLAALAILT
jgi:hypothetical protein